ncbi:OHCU decarboxylase-domain-containing protein [Parachaetomium inaequale]|uniref:OHCU decarboxylase-domain-containing protein n=1 Tax=Parachaetomium inaequale TaxID=2588326 RepID=A0AAN6PEX9_9PEZI|nr:OHCU decarboxylase-domain-containing protein [Parachaetomium inaequale]
MTTPAAPSTQQPQPQTEQSPPTLNPTATPFLPAITTLRTLSPPALTATLDLLFEPSPDLHALALPTVRTLSFASYDDLIATLRTQLLDIAAAVEGDAEGRRRLYGVLGSHPRLGRKKKEEGGENGGMSGLSKAEQGHLTGAEVEEELGRLNEEYERRFPGLRYVVWVNGRGREEVVADMRARIERGDLRGEERAVIEAMCDIAADRARKLLQKSAEEAVENSKS